MGTPHDGDYAKLCHNPRNRLFAGHPNGANAAATLCGLIATARTAGLDPYQYFRFLFSRIPHAKTEQDFRALVPGNLTPQILSRFMAVTQPPEFGTLRPCRSALAYLAATRNVFREDVVH